MNISHTLEDGVCDIKIVGNVVWDTAVPFEQHIRAVMELEGVSAVLLDMSSVNYMDSSGIGNVIMLHRECESHRFKLALYGLNGVCYSLFEMTRLDTVLKLCVTRGEALKAATG